MLKYRILTALLLIPLFILAIFKLPFFVFTILLALIFALSALEWANLIPLKPLGLQLLYVFFLVAVFFLSVFLPPMVLLIFGLLMLLWSLLSIIRYEKNQTPIGFQFSIIRAMLGILYLLPSWTAVMLLETGRCFGRIWLLYALVIIWAADTGAYFSGRWLGKHLLAHRVSPKKTWEGFLGGMALALVFAVLGVFFLPIGVAEKFMVTVLATIMALFSVIGDLAISLLKRITGLKDSGKILPGHGGILDRLDSIGAGLIVFTLGLLLLKICQ